MKTLIRLAKKSAKNIQKKLLENGKPFCTVLNAEVAITKEFLNHISYTKNRPHKEIMQRLLIAGFIAEIFVKGTILEIRKDNQKTFYRISAEFGIDIFSIIIVKNKEEVFLLSCFLELKYQKKDLSQPPMVYHARSVQVF